MTYPCPDCPDGHRPERRLGERRVRGAESREPDGIGAELLADAMFIARSKGMVYDGITNRDEAEVYAGQYNWLVGRDDALRPEPRDIETMVDGIVERYRGALDALAAADEPYQPVTAAGLAAHRAGHPPYQGWSSKPVVSSSVKTWLAIAAAIVALILGAVAYGSAPSRAQVDTPSAVGDSPGLGGASNVAARVTSPAPALAPQRGQETGHGARNTPASGLDGAPSSADGASASAQSVSAPDTSTAALQGIATWYDAPSRTDAAAGPLLRKALGKHWRGKWVTVDVGPREALVQLTDWCACGDRHGEPTILDLDDRTFLSLSPLNVGVIEVEVRWGGPAPSLPPTDTAP